LIDLIKLIKCNLFHLSQQRRIKLNIFDVSSFLLSILSHKLFLHGKHGLNTLKAKFHGLGKDLLGDLFSLCLKHNHSLGISGNHHIQVCLFKLRIGRMGSLEFSAAQFAWKYTPCDELAGDFLNYFPLDERHIAMFVVDVSGHGAASALLAVAVGRLLTAHASASSLLVHRASESSPLEITPPAEVARELNRRFPMESQNGLYFTMAYGILDVETKELCYVVAGHPPLVHIPRGAGPQILPGDGFAIGMLDDVDYDEQSIQLQPGDRVYYYSDGVPEAMNVNLDQFTDDRMLEVLSQSIAKPLAATVDSLFEAVRVWCVPNGPKDDVSILGCEIAAESG